MLPDELTPLEHRLVVSAVAGKEFDCAANGATTAELDAIENWDDRKIRAEVLVALCTEEMPDRSVHPRRGLRLRGAYVVGHVDLTRALLTQCPLAFQSCRFEEGIKLSQATVSELRFTSCIIASLDGNELNSSASLHLAKTHLHQLSLVAASFRGGIELSEVSISNPESLAFNGEHMSVARMRLRDARVEGEMYLVDARIRGQLTCSGSTELINPSGKALNGDRLHVSELALRKTCVKGEVYLAGAKISGQLICSEGTELINPGADALAGDSLSAEDIFLRPKQIKGEVRLVGAQLNGQLICKNTKLINPGAHALAGDGLSAAEVQLSNVHVEGEVRLIGAQISGDLICSEHTKLDNPGAYALAARECRVVGMFYFCLAKRVDGKVDLTRSQVGTLHDDLASWPHTYNLVGLSYHSLWREDHAPDDRLDWLRRSDPFSPNVYTQLAEVYQRSGHQGLARKVAIAREKEAGRRPDLSWWVRTWNRFLGLTVDYGYRPWKALVPFVVLLALGWFLFSLPAAHEVMVSAPQNSRSLESAAVTCHDYPCFTPLIYTLDVLLPIIDFHQERNWVPASERPWGLWYEALLWILIATGWILTTAVVAGIGSLWRK